MHAATSRSGAKTGLALGLLTLASSLLLAACGGGSTAADSAPASSAPSVAASSAPSVAASSEDAGPPRPTGMSDDDWALILGSLDPDAYRERLLSKTPDELATSCQMPAITDEDRQAAADSGVVQFPGSTVEEWMALYDYFLPESQAVKDEVCASAAAAEGSGEMAASSFDPPRPTGVPDSDWAAYLSTWNPQDWQAQVNDFDPEILTEYCAKDEASVREDTIGGLPENAAAEYPESTLEEWTAFFDYAFAGLEAVRQQACANS